jgi:hypothetical protein
MSGDPRLTEERLRTWLDANQAARERLCAHILSLNRRFSQVRPRQPKGGPDDGYDIEAVELTGRAIGAIGFRNSPTDGAADQRWVRTKFKHDLTRALESAGAFRVFVFFTNVRLTVGARQKLLELGKTIANVEAEIIDREVMRLSLDSPEGFAARFQYLRIPLNEPEQTAFFARWGEDLANLVSTSFAVLEERLHRLEFLHERDRPLRTLAFHIRLHEPATIAELPHVRAYLSLGNLSLSLGRSQWHIGVCNNSPLRNAENCGSGPCLASAFWPDDVSKPHGTSASTWQDPFTIIGAHGGFHEFSDPALVATMADLDDSFFAFFMNQQLFARTAAIHIFANEYLLWSATAEELKADSPNAPPETVWQFSPEELSDSWVRVMPKNHTGWLHFSSSTPRRLRAATRVASPI